MHIGRTRTSRLIRNGGAFAAILCVTGTASAGFLFQTSSVFVNTPRSGSARFTVGDVMYTDGFGGFFNYVPDTAADPVIHPLDLPLYKYTLDGQVVASSGELVVYTGTYSIFIDQRPFGVPDYYVSQGTFWLTATFTSESLADLDGTLTQTTGPDEPEFFDLSYGGNTIRYEGHYTETVPGTGGTFQGVLRQEEQIPGVGTLGSLVGGALFARRRRR